MENKLDIEALLPRALAVYDGNAKALADAIGLTKTTISQWCGGGKSPSLQSLVKLAKVTGDDPTEVCTAYIEKNRNDAKAG